MCWFYPTFSKPKFFTFLVAQLTAKGDKSVAVIMMSLYLCFSLFLAISARRMDKTPVPVPMSNIWRGIGLYFNLRRPMLSQNCFNRFKYS
jgi:hypothetical protein